MSYCHTCSGGMNNITTYFHPQVAPVMRAAADASCLGPDTGGCTTDAYESNDSCGAAASVSPGVINGLYSCETDDDYYQVSVPPGAQLTVDITFSNATADLDLQIWNSACSNLLDGSYSVSDAESVTWTNTSSVSEIITIKEYMYSSVPTSPYSMMVTVLGCVAPDAYEDNDTCATATPWVDGTVVGLSVDKLDKDHYSFCIAAGATVDADILFSTATADCDLFLWDASDVNCGSGAPGTQLAYGFTTSDNETVSYTNLTGAHLDVVLEVNVWASSNGDCNNYDLIVSGTGNCTGPAISTFCDPSALNCNGRSTTLGGTLVGSTLTLDTSNGPDDSPLEFGYYLASFGTNTGLPISNGYLCLGDALNTFERFNSGPINSPMNSTGTFDGLGDFSVGTTGLDFTVPAMMPSGAMYAGSTAHFQMWHRDTCPAGESNFSNGLSVMFP